MITGINFVRRSDGEVPSRAYPAKLIDFRIETQDLLLQALQTERTIEIGPSSTLTTMANRTWSLKYQSFDEVRSFGRQFLSTSENSEEIYYSGSQETVDLQEPPQSSEKTQAVSNAPEIQPSILPAVFLREAPVIHDEEITAREVIASIVAVSMKKQPQEVSFSNSLKELSAGKSVLQNELIGDLEAEFGFLPESPEDLPLAQLCASVEKRFSGKLGSRSKALINKMTAAKMTGSFNATTIRDYLRRSWGLQNGRQDAVILLAVSFQPNKRLENEAAAKQFWDKISEGYISRHGLRVSQEQVENTPPSPLHSEHREEVMTPAHKLIQPSTLFQLHAPSNRMIHNHEAEISRLDRKIANLQTDLDLWISEHGLEYAVGIKPLFDIYKVRQYDSFWNWVMQDVTALVSDVLNGVLQPNDSTTITRRQNLINRLTPEVIHTLEYLSTKYVKHPREEWISALLRDCHQANAVALKGPSSEVPSTGDLTNNEDKLRPFESDDNSSEDFTSESDFHREILMEEMSTRDVDSSFPSERSETLHRVSIQQKRFGQWKTSVILTKHYTDNFLQASKRRVLFRNKNVLVTGAGQNSIAVEIVRLLLTGGARVILTTSSDLLKATKFYQKLYADCGADGSRLLVVPFNQASHEDIRALVEYIYQLNSGEWDLDHVIPFAAISESTCGLNDLGSRSELAHRLMLTNTLRLLGAIKMEKETRLIVSRPAQVILPLSPNHGSFGNDGLYTESKLGLEGLLSKWHSEDWSEYLSICGVIIGWTRGTSLMAGNDGISEAVENLGVTTYSQQEMAGYILSLMTSHVLEASQLEPLVADIGGGLSKINGLKQHITNIRQRLSESSSAARARAFEISNEDETKASHHKSTLPKKPINRRANFKFDFPRLPDFESDVLPLNAIKGMVDLERVIVIAGFAEVGPCGNSRTRWEMEAHGELSIEGCIEMAWMMGLIEHRKLETMPSNGWVEKSTGKHIAEKDIKEKYEHYISEHSGIRFIEPRDLDGQDPELRDVLHEIEIQQDLPGFETSRETADEFQKKHGVKVTISPIEGSDQVRVVLQAGARVLIPKALKFDRTVGGQVPTGWCAKTYGIEDEIINQVDPAVLYLLVCTAEAFLAAGVTDPYEFYEYIHVSELGTCIGSGFGGAASLQGIFKERFLDKVVSKDVLAESFVNTGSAWVNMLLTSSAGPNITPVGACATAIESLDVACELICCGKAKIVVAGAYDYLLKDVSYEFGNMKATNNTEEDVRSARSPKEMSRPTTTTRNGFVEAEGAGVQILTSAKLALEMGLPIHGIIALTTTASDKMGMSLPAPGRGILTASAEVKSKFDPPLMNMAYRRRCLSLRESQINEIAASEVEFLEREISTLRASDGVQFDIEQYQEQRAADISAAQIRQMRDALNSYGNDFWRQDQRISPIRGSLAVWGLTIDDLNVASFHGTSTTKNDLNESEVFHTQMCQLGRSQGNPVLGVFQKSLTGHPKGPAGAWMLNGCLQILDSGLVPGNRNADNIDAALRKFHHIVYPNRSIQTPNGVKAFSVTSFGFGQKGAQVIGVHPKYLFAALDETSYEQYSAKVRKRQQKAYKHFHQTFVNNNLFQAKKSTPYPAEHETEFLCNPSSRVPMNMNC